MLDIIHSFYLKEKKVSTRIGHFRSQTYRVTLYPMVCTVVWLLLAVECLMLYVVLQYRRLLIAWCEEQSLVTNENETAKTLKFKAVINWSPTDKRSIFRSEVRSPLPEHLNSVVR